MLGAFGALYRYALSQTAPIAPDPTTGQVVEIIRAWRGQPIGSFYVTWWENAVSHALLGCAATWMVIVIGWLVMAAILRR